MTTKHSKDFGFGEDEALVRDTARRFLDEKSSVERLRRVVASDHEDAYEGAEPPCYWDASVWSEVVDLGWTSLAVPEDRGGFGMKLVGVAALVEEIGRHAFPSPLLSTLLATCVLREADGPGAALALERVVAGEAATLASTGADGSWEIGDVDVSARADGDGVVLDGTAAYVQDARKAAFFVVSAKGEDGLGLYVVPKDAAGVEIRPDRILDLTRDQARIVLKEVRVPADAVVAAAPKGGACLERALPACHVLVAADVVGAAEWQLQTTVEYAKIRKQFDRPIGFFQAVKHPIVDVMLAVDETRSLVYAAACAFDEEPDAAALPARMAKESSAETALFASNRSIQMHGGIGMTWEADLHVYFKRQLHSRFLFGDAAHHRRRIADAL